VRVPIPEDISAEVLFQHDHTCCVCNQPGKAVQIHHVDDDHTNNDPKNLAVLCLADHDLTQIKGGFGRKLSAAEVTKNRDGWVSRVQQRRVDADKLAVGKMIGAEFRESAAVEAGWKQPSSKLLATYVESLPDVLRQSYIQAHKLWDTGSNRAMINGTRLVIDVLEQSWVHLSAWFSPRHFGGKSSAEYFSSYIASRYLWNYALEEPEADGSRGQHAHLMYVSATMNDIEGAVADTALSLGDKFVEGFDKKAWQTRWDSAKTAGG
jgi:hypothetical protein